MSRSEATLVEYKIRFWSKVDIRGPDDCWRWQAGCYPIIGKKGGYGRFWLHGKDRLAHRIALFGFGDEGEILFDPEVQACHFCDVTHCCNPRHLFIATNFGNCRDKVNKGRQIAGNNVKGKSIHGSAHKSAKLDEEKVLAIRHLILKGETPKQLASIYGVSRATIDGIAAGRSWEHVVIG